MTGGEFRRKLDNLGKKRKVSVRYDAAHGKGSHGRIYYGAKFTALKDLKHEIGSGLLGKMCRDLGIKPKELQ